MSDLRQAATGRDHLWVERDFDQCALWTRKCCQQLSFKLPGVRDANARVAVRPRESCKVWVGKPGATHVVRVFALLVHAYRAKHAIVQYQNNAFCADLRRCGELLPIHHEIAIACDGEGDALTGHRVFGQNIRGNTCRHAVAHGAIGGSKLGFEAFGQAVVLVEAVQPAGKVACAIGQHGICWQVLLQRGNDGGHVDGAREFQPAIDRVDVGQVINIRILRPSLPRQS